MMCIECGKEQKRDHTSGLCIYCFDKIPELDQFKIYYNNTTNKKRNINLNMTKEDPFDGIRTTWLLKPRDYKMLDLLRGKNIISIVLEMIHDEILKRIRKKKK